MFVVFESICVSDWWVVKIISPICLALNSDLHTKLCVHIILKQQIDCCFHCCTYIY